MTHWSAPSGGRPSSGNVRRSCREQGWVGGADEETRARWRRRRCGRVGTRVHAPRQESGGKCACFSQGW